MEPTMTFAASDRSRRDNNAPGGFTLVELLIVIGIIVLLGALLLGAVMHARMSARATRMAADLQAIAMGLEAYRHDFGDYPRLPPVGYPAGAPNPPNNPA